MTTVAPHATCQHVLFGVGNGKYPPPCHLDDQPDTKYDRDAQKRFDSAEQKSGPHN